MINFVNKIVEKTAKTPSEDMHFIVVWENNQFYAKKGNHSYPIHRWDDLTFCKQAYSLPANDYWPVWTIKKPFNQKRNTNPTYLNSIKRFWGKYRPGLKIHGDIKNNVFYERSVSTSN
jgi:hypothetical protein